MIPITPGKRNHHTATRPATPHHKQKPHLKHDTDTTEHGECGKKSCHSRSRGESFAVRWEMSPGAARIEVEDMGGPWRPRKPDDRPHGLDMPIQALTGDGGWGTQATGTGRLTWARLSW